MFDGNQMGKQSLFWANGVWNTFMSSWSYELWIMVGVENVLDRGPNRPVGTVSVNPMGIQYPAIWETCKERTYLYSY